MPMKPTTTESMWLRATLCWLFAMPLPALRAQGRELLPKPVEFVTAHDDSLFSLPRSQEDIHNLETAIRELETGELQSAVERLHKLLQHETGGLVPVAGGRFYGLRLAVVLTLANLQPAAAAAYENLVRREAGNLGQRPLAELSTDQLQLLANRFPAADVGRRARLRLGDLQLERGNGLAAAAHYRLGLDASPLGSQLERDIRARLRAAAVLEDPRDHRDDADPAPVVQDVLSVLPPADDAIDWPMPGGRYGSRGTMDEPAGRPQSQSMLEIKAHGQTYRGGTFSMFPVGDLQGIFVNDGIEVLAFDPLRKEMLWQSQVPLRELGEPAVIENDYEDTYNENMVLAPALGRDTVVAALQVPENSENVDFRAGFRILYKIPERRLFAWDRRSGKLLWSHYDQLEGPVTRRFRGHTACGPPIVVGDTVYAPTHDRSNAIAFYLSAYDLHTGKTLWRRLICSSQQDVNMFGNARAEFAGSPLLAANGVIYGSTNLGVCFAVDMLNGQLRWLSSYDVVQMPPTQLRRQADRPVYFANNPPALLQGTVAVMPLDSQYVLGIDAETGKQLWRLPYQARTSGNNDVRWLLGCTESEFVLAGAGVVAVAAHPQTDDNLIAAVRSIQRPEYLRDNRFSSGETPRPALTDHLVYFPAPSQLTIFDLDGNIAKQSGEFRPQAPGNLLLVDGMVVSLRDRRLEILYDKQALRQRAETRQQQQPDDPAALLRLASLNAALLDANADASALRAIEQLYRRGLEAAEKKGLPKTSPVRQALASQLFAAAFARASTARATGAADAVTLLLQARQEAPDLAAWMQAEQEIVAALPDRQAVLQELDAAAAHAGSGTFTLGDHPAMPVAAWVLWQKALHLTDGKAAVACWQQLLERFADIEFDSGTAGELATAAIAQSIKTDGPEVYAAVETRAAAALQAAGNDAGALRSLCAVFPHSQAAVAAQQRLLDAAVERGDLRAVCEVLARAQSVGDAGPGLLRRTLLATLRGGNRGLAQALATRLRKEHGAEVSDWAPDRGKTFAAVVETLAAELAPPPPPPPPQVPRALLATIEAAGSRLLPPMLQPDGFTTPADAPLYVLAQDPATRDEMLVALDLQASVERPPELFRVPVKFPDPVILCGRVLVIADLVTVSGLDYRTGERLWQLDNPYTCLGVQSGVLHLSMSPSRPGGVSQFVGVEPCSGATLFARTPPPTDGSRTPKGAGDQLLLFELHEDTDPVLHRLDPVTGLAAVSIPFDAAVLRQLGIEADGLARAKMFPSSLCADADHVFLPIDAQMSDGPSHLGALSNQGRLDWVWTGSRGRRLMMAARRGERLCVVEADSQGGRALLLRASNGEVLRSADLGGAVQPLNWQRGWLPCPAPAGLLIADRDRSGTPRLTCFGIDDGVPTFAQGLTPQDDNAVPTPFLGPDFVCFAVRPAAQRGACRVYALQLDDRKGAMAAGAKFLGLPGSGPYMLGTAGPYTVLATADQLMILGDERTK